ncbi:MAG: PAS domain S-box protein [Geobacteraceae bacterium]|nr:PAS domain S-box protein [Geobacteraceae bacterium]
MLSLFLGGTVLFSLVVNKQASLFSNTCLISLLSLYLLQICLALFWLLRFGPSPRFVQIQIVWDLVMCAAVVYFTGGMYSDFAFLFIFVILTSGLISSRHEVLLILLASIVLYGGLATLDYYGYLPVYPWNTRSGTDVFYLLFLNLAAFVLAAFIGAILSTRLQQYAQKLATQRREHSELEHFNHLILQNITSGLILVNSQGRILLANKVAEQICAIKATQVTGMPITTALPRFAWPLTQIPVERGELNFSNASGRQLILGYSATSIQQGESTNVLLMFQDLTEIKRLEQNLKREEHLASIGSLSAGLAHEIRNPLASLGGSVQLLQEKDFPATEQRLFNIIAREAGRLNHLVDDFLNFASPRNPVQRKVDINSILSDVLHLAQGSRQFKEIQINASCPDVWYENVDEEQIKQVVWNLLGNAASFCPPGGRVHCASCKRTRSFWIDDSGPGVDPKMGDTIFEPFTTSRADGTGLGLAIAHAFARANGAGIEYAAAPDGGARFKVTFKNQNSDGLLKT